MEIVRGLPGSLGTITTEPGESKADRGRAAPTALGRIASTTGAAAAAATA